MKRILLPTDFSDNAFNAITYAIKLFQKVTCEFYLLHTFTPAAHNFDGVIDTNVTANIFEIEQNAVNLNLKELEQKLQKQFNNTKHKFIAVSAYNMLIPEMKSLIKNEAIDLVVMGTKGATGAKEVFIGTHTMHAIKKLKCPVLAVPESYNFKRPKEVLFPTDYKLEKSNIYLELLRDICSLHSSKLHFLNAHYSSPLEEKQKRAKVFLDIFFIDNTHQFHIEKDEDLVQIIEAFQHKNKIDFLVMIHNKHTMLENLLFRPVINKMVYHTQVPFLVLPSKEKMEKM